MVAAIGLSGLVVEGRKIKLRATSSGVERGRECWSQSLPPESKNSDNTRIGLLPPRSDKG
jgi:hypothetical protein